MMHPYRAPVVLVLFLALLGPVAGCGGKVKDKRAGEAAARPDSLPRAEDAVVMEGGPGIYGGRYVSTVRNDPKTWNSLVSNETSTTDLTNGLIFEGLTEFNNKTQETGPRLAKSWEVSADGLTYTFHLRRGLRWSDGRPFTAADVLFTARVAYDDLIHSASADLLKVGGQPFGFEAPDDYTIVVRLPRPYGPLLTVIGSLYIMPKHKLEANYLATLEQAGKPLSAQERTLAATAGGKGLEAAYGTDTPPSEIVGLGPWRLAEYLPQQKVVMRPNPYFYGYDARGHRLPYLDELIYLVVADQNAEVLRFRGGESDEIYFRAEDYAAMKEGAEAGDYTVYELGTEMGTNMFWFNMNRRVNPKTGKPYVDPVKQRWFNDLSFRRAVAHGVDREAMSRTVFYGLAQPLYGTIPAVNKKWHNANIVTYPYNLDEARRLLEEAGYRDGNGDGIREDPEGHPLSIVLVTSVDNKERVGMAGILADDLAKIGIQCQVSAVEFNSVITKLRDTLDYDAIMFALTGGVPPDPIMSANVFKSSGKTHFWNPEQPTPGTAWEAEVDSLMDAQISLSDPADRKAVFDRVQRIVSEQCPAIYTVSRPGFLAVRNKFTGLEPTVLRPWVLWQSETLVYDPERARQERARRSG